MLRLPGLGTHPRIDAGGASDKPRVGAEEVLLSNTWQRVSV
jgi:hypothetical protein